MFLRKVWLLPVYFYRWAFSPFFGRCCKYQPTCSRYMIDAVMKKGVLRGTLLGFWRILRCSPLSRGGYDPVD